MLSARRLRPVKSRRSAVVTAAAPAAAPVPVALGPDIDVYRFGVAIGADATAAGHGPDVVRQFPFGDAGNLDVGGGAVHVQRVLGTVGAAVAGGVAVARRDHHLAAVMAFDRFQHAHQRGLQAGDIDAFVLLQQTVGREPGHAGGGRNLIAAADWTLVLI